MMSEWLKAIGDALPIIVALVLVIWGAIRLHGDTRWLKREEAVDRAGEMKWPGKDVVKRIEGLVLGQNDDIADHENRLGRLEEREETVLREIRAHLEVLGSKMDDVRDRVTRLEERAKNGRNTGKETS